MNIKETIRAEIERIKKENKCPSIHNDLEFSVWSAKDDLLDNILYLLDSLSEQPVEGLEEAAEEWCKTNNKGIALSADKKSHYLAEGKDAFKVGAEWGEKNAYKAIMKEADKVRDKRFNTDYEVKIEPALGFDLGCVNVYHEGKLVGQYIEPKEEKKRLGEAAKEYTMRLEKNNPATEAWDFGGAFKAGAEYASPRWISVDERLPEVDEEVIVLIDDFGTAPIYRIGFAFIVDTDVTIMIYGKPAKPESYNGWNAPNVKYWMPCPTIPNSEDYE